MKPDPTPADRFEQAPFKDRIRRDDLVYFLVNVGDADAQVILLPEDESGQWKDRRRAIVVDAGAPLGETGPRTKVPGLLKALDNPAFMGTAHTGWQPGTIPLVVASHPHLDHIAAMPDILNNFRTAILEFWDPGYYHTLPEYKMTMQAIESSTSLVYCNPTSGLRRWFGDVVVTVLSPSIQLRNRFDSYGVEVNDASISLKIDYPAGRYIERDDNTREWKGRRIVVQSLILGGDAQTTSWAHVLVDYPFLGASDSEAAKALRAATGADPLRAKVLKTSHHASKHGVNLELVERVGADIALVSCDADHNRYHFPHSYAQDALREAKDPLAGKGLERTKKDWELGIMYTSDTTGPPRPGEPSANTPPAGTQLGTIAVVFGHSTQRREIWRFGDDKAGAVKLDNGFRMRDA